MGRARVLSVMVGEHAGPPPRGEIWVAPAVLESQGLSNDAAGIAELAANLRADLCFMSCGGPQAIPRQRESMREAVAAAHERDLACGVVVDGPWQRLSQEVGLLQLLQRLGRRDDRIQGDLAAQAELAHDELRAWATSGADLLLLADDVAYSRAPYFPPATLALLLLPLYHQFLASTADLRTPLGFHSDGDLTLLLPQLVDAGFSFFSLEPEAMDLAQVHDRYGERVVLVSGIAAAWLCGEDLAGVLADDLAAGTSYLKRIDRLILASACGLSGPTSLAALRQVYRAVDRRAQEH